MKFFIAPERSLGNLSAEVAAKLIATAADVVLIVDSDGVVRDGAFGDPNLDSEVGAPWLGRPWRDTVTSESVGKVDDLLREASSSAGVKWRQINQLTDRAQELPVLFTVMPVNADGRVVALGRDLRQISNMQQRLLDVQQSMERDYARLRHMETRYRLLFERTSDAVVVVDAMTYRMLEVNPAAASMLVNGTTELLGRSFVDVIDTDDQAAVAALLAGVNATGRESECEAHLHRPDSAFTLAASLFRQENVSLLLLRLRPHGAEMSPAAVSFGADTLGALVDRMPDGFVVTDTHGVILSANSAFLDLVQLASQEQARGESLDNWLGRPGVDLNVLLANLRQHGAVRLFQTTLRVEYGGNLDIEVSAADDESGARFAFAIRNVGRRMSGEARPGKTLPRSVDQLTELVGRVPLKDLVRETTDVIERLCIEAALELTKGNRASAAEILGLSRQSLYVKLRRYGLSDPDADDET